MVRVHVRAPFARSQRVSGLWCNSSISAREADGPGANPGFLTNDSAGARASAKPSGETAVGLDLPTKEFPSF